jgi:hypothetical protein
MWITKSPITVAKIIERNPAQITLRARITVHLGQHVAEDVRDREEEMSVSVSVGERSWILAACEK